MSLAAHDHPIDKSAHVANARKILHAAVPCFDAVVVKLHARECMNRAGRKQPTYRYAMPHLLLPLPTFGDLVIVALVNFIKNSAYRSS
jgi:hypothetical protein